ncbi:MAG TPA: hypothetical protein VGQ62_14060 [Chloroflexota bacterium]|jgi:photosystem II stability/assembly factor-like uncharacterized protein|nr:hypothetical protein [Chloroflexota bacterium]
MGTSDGLFLVERSAAGAASAQALGLEHKGGFRAPVVVDCADPRRVYAGTTRAGLFCSEDAGATWREINSGILYKDIWALTQHPTTGVLYVGTSPAGVFRSDDRGETWTACESLWQLPSTRQWHGPIPPYVSRLKDLTVSDADPDFVIGAIEEGWVVCSRDGGVTWQQINNGVPHDSHSVRFVPGAPHTLVLTSNDGMFRSTDSGATWVASNDGLQQRRYTPAPLVTRKSRPGVLFTSATAVGPGEWRRPEGGDAAFCRSTDGGQSWTTLTTGLPHPLAAIPRAIAVDPSNSAGYIAGLTDGTLWATDDDGASFQPLLDGHTAIMSLTPRPVFV